MRKILPRTPDIPPLTSKTGEEFGFGEEWVDHVAAWK
jgi:hypothetical protein